MPIKSFRGLIADGSIDTIPLSTNDGSTGYKITKMELITNKPGDNIDSEHIVKVYSIPQTSVDGVIDFSDNTLLAAGITTNAINAYLYTIDTSIVFDNVIFNQDIYVTHTDLKNNEAANYYIELEQIKLDLNENTVATLKDIRNIEAQ